MISPLIRLEQLAHTKFIIPFLDLVQHLFGWNEVDSVKHINLLSAILMLSTGLLGICLIPYGKSRLLETLTITAFAIGFTFCMHHAMLLKELNRMSKSLKRGYGLNPSAVRQFQMAMFTIVRPIATWALPLGVILTISLIQTAKSGEIGWLIAINFLFFQIVVTLLVHAWSRLDQLLP